MWKRRSFNLARSRMQRKKFDDTNRIRRSHWMRVIVSTLPSIIFGVFTVVFTLQQNISARATREQDQRYADVLSKRAIFDNYIDVISDRLLSSQFNRNSHEHLQTIRGKTLTTIRHLDRDYKKEIIIFLYENNLTQSTLSIEQRLNLDGADLSDGIQFRRSITNRCVFNDLYLSGVFASNILFDGCELERSIFNGSIMTESQFINCSLTNSSFVGSFLHQANFHHTDLDRTNFTGAVLTKTTFFRGIFREVDLTNADLFESNISDEHLNIPSGSTRRNNLRNTRFPNGSYPYIDSRQLVKDGGAEEECSKNKSTVNWFDYRNQSEWLWVNENNRSLSSSLPEPISGKCYFFANTNSRNYQHLDVKHFSTLIEHEAAWCNFSAYMGCSDISPNMNVSIDLAFVDARNLFDSNHTLTMTSGKKGFHFETMIGLIPPYTRKISVRIGAVVKNISQYCMMDEIKVFIFQYNQTLPLN